MYKAHSHHTKEQEVSISINKSSFTSKLYLDITKNVRSGLAQLATKKACWGIKDQGDLALIMGVLNFGDPAHTVPNTPKNSERRKMIEDAIDTFGGNDSAIPPRPWLSRSTEGYYKYSLRKYIEDNLPKVVKGIPKKGPFQSISSTQSMSINDFVEGLAKVGAENARDSWDNGNFAPNKPMTLANKADSRPLHGSGRMNRGSITAWSA